MAKKIFFIIITFFTVLMLAPKLQAVNAAYLKLDPTTFNLTTGQTFEVKVNTSLGSEQAVGVDAVILYNKNLLQAQLVKYGTFFSQVSADITDEGKVKIYAYSSSITDTKSGEGTIGTIVFQTKNGGSGNLSFDCSASSTTDSNIIKNDDSSSDIIQCASNIGASYTITTTDLNPSPTVSSLTPTPTLVSSLPIVTVTPTIVSLPTITPTLIPAPSATIIPTSTPGELPRAGIYEDTLKLLLFGVGLIAVGLIMRFVRIYSS